eukprot:g5003.t1
MRRLTCLQCPNAQVLLEIKKSETEKFLFETSCATANADLIDQVARAWNLRLRIEQLCGACDELGKHGPMKPPDKMGIDEIEDQGAEQAMVEVKQAERSANYAADPLGHRTGNAPDAKVAGVIAKTCADARAYIDKAHVARREPQQLDLLQEKIDHIRGAVMIAFPMGLPAYDTVRVLIEGNDAEAVQGSMDPLSARLWWAGKEFLRDQTVGDRVGRNEKTKVICRLQGAKGGPPSREPAVSEAERKAMMAHYFKKQEEMKKLAENDDDDFHGASWANSGQLKGSLLGTASIKAPGLR